VLEAWKERVRALKIEIHVLTIAYRDRRTPWLARAWLALVLAYALSPIDLIPDFVPVLGYVDDLILLPLGIALAIRLIPAEVLDEARKTAAQAAGSRIGWLGAGMVIVAWLVVLGLAVAFIARQFNWPYNNS
jgi:uncharacterized membrane protein YkvA (DUF1232 family)